MTDERLRNVERRARAGSDLHDEARLVLERLRAGELPGAAVDLAATLGHRAACAALGREPVGVEGLALVVAGGDEDRRARAALALAELALPAWTYPDPPDHVVPGEPVRAAVTTLRAAQTRPGVGAGAVGDEAAVAIHTELLHVTPPDLLRSLAARVIARAALLLGEERQWYALDAVRRAAGLFGVERVRQALQGALLPAALRPAPAAGPPPEWTDEAGLIARRLASGAITRERVMLAHALGYAPASQALGLTASGGTDEGRWLEALSGLGALGAEAGVRSVVAIAADELARDEDTAAGRALRAAGAWLLEPTEARARAAADAARAAAEAPGSYRLTPERQLLTMVNAQTAVAGAAPELAELAARAAARAGLEGLAPVDEVRQAIDTGTFRHVDSMAAVFQEVAPWALGYGDAVRDRAEEEGTVSPGSSA